MKQNTNSKNLNEAVKNAKDYSLAGIATAVYQVGWDSFVATCTPLSDGMIVGVWMNGCADSRYLSIFSRN